MANRRRRTARVRFGEWLIGRSGEEEDPVVPTKLKTDPNLPGAVLSEPKKSITITSRGKQIDYDDDIGMSISVPKDATVKEILLDIATSFSGRFEMPNNVASVSPAYLIEAVTGKAELEKDMTLKLQHSVKFEIAEDMVVLKACFIPGSTMSKFEEIEGVNVNFEKDYALIKLKSLESSAFKIAIKKREGFTAEKFYSARLYKAVEKKKIEAVFCMCPEHPIYTKHCDKVIANKFPKMANKANGTFINALIIDSEEVALVKPENQPWKITMDRSMISKLEVDSPERMDVEVSKLEDYPPIMKITLIPNDKASGALNFKVNGLRKEQLITVANECQLPSINTQDFLDATKELESEVFKVNYDSPLATCAMDLDRIMLDIEPLATHFGSVDALVVKVDEIQLLISSLIKLLEPEKSDEAVFTRISNDLKRAAASMKTQNPDSWNLAAKSLLSISVTLMKTLKDQLIADTSVGVSLKTLNMMKYGKKKRFRLINLVSSKWHITGLILGVPLDLLEGWRMECLGNASRCWNKVMGHWIADGGTQNYPPTWEGIYVLLEDIECSQVAKELKEVIAIREKKKIK